MSSLISKLRTPARRVFSHSILLMGALAACEKHGAVVSPSDGVARSTLPGTKGPLMQRADDQQYRRVNSLAPTFGGLYVDESGNPTVVLLDVNHLNAAAAALHTVFGRGFDRRFGTRSLRAVQGKYSYTQLSDWRSQLSPLVLKIEGVSNIGMSIRKNRVTVGLSNEAAKAAVNALLTQVGLPADAIVFEPGIVGVRVSTIRDSIRPVPAAYQITSSAPGVGFCTLGANGGPASNPSGTYYFITASHCTRVVGTVDSTVFTQPNGNGRLGIEVADAETFPGGTGECPAGSTCQEADAALIKYDNGADANFGYMARVNSYPPAFNYANGSVTVYAPYPVDSFDWVSGYEQTMPAMEGDTVSKLGVTTGWTRGIVVNTCQNIPTVGTNFWLTCQVWVQYAAADHGDSGAPVVITNPPGNSSPAVSYVLYGIVADKLFFSNDNSPAGFSYTKMESVRAWLHLNPDSFLFCSC